MFKLMARMSDYIKQYKLDIRLLREIDKKLFFSIVLLVCFGILNIYLCTKGRVDGISDFYFAKKQIIWFLISLAATYVLIAIDYKDIYRFIPILYWLVVALLILVLIIGEEKNGAKGWLDIGPMELQPAEFAKFTIILMQAKILNECDFDINNIKNFSKVAIYALIPMGLIAKQPDMGMTLVCFFIMLGIVFIAGIDKRIIIGGILICFAAVIILWPTGIIKNHQKQRILTFLNPDTEDSADSYQLNQSIIGIGAGGVLGERPSFASEVAPGYTGTHVPEIQTDFIFAAIGEQWGFVGAIVLLLLYLVLLCQIISTARNTDDKFAKVICIGMVSYFIFAITQNICMTIGLLPITGITLPLISYGGSSLLTIMMALALVINIGMRKRKIHF